MTIRFLPEMRQEADRVARSRCDAHDRTGRRPGESQGSREKNLRGDYLGVQAELAVRQLFADAGIRAAFSKLDTYDPRPDVILPDGQRLDVKGTADHWVKINDKRHGENRARVDYYLPVQVTGGVAVIYRPVPWGDVSRWSLRTGHSPYRSCPVSSLTPLQGVSDLIGLMPLLVGRAV